MVNAPVSEPNSEAVGSLAMTLMVGGGSVTTTLAVPVLPPELADTVNAPAAPVALKSPLPLTVPPPVAAQLNEGWEDNALVNWSLAVELYCWEEPWTTVELTGVSAMEVSVWFTVTFTM